MGKKITVVEVDIYNAKISDKFKKDLRTIYELHCYAQRMSNLNTERGINVVWDMMQESCWSVKDLALISRAMDELEEEGGDSQINKNELVFIMRAKIKEELARIADTYQLRKAVVDQKSLLDKLKELQDG